MINRFLIKRTHSLNYSDCPKRKVFRFAPRVNAPLNPLKGTFKYYDFPVKKRPSLSLRMALKEGSYTPICELRFNFSWLPDHWCEVAFGNDLLIHKNLCLKYSKLFVPVFEKKISDNILNNGSPFFVDSIGNKL